MSNHAEFERRIGRLEAENRELRQLWIDTEGDVIALKVKLGKRLSQRLMRALRRLRRSQNATGDPKRKD